MVEASTAEEARFDECDSTNPDQQEMRLPSRLSHGSTSNRQPHRSLGVLAGQDVSVGCFATAKNRQVPCGAAISQN
jgi:hypothetical protein